MVQPQLPGSGMQSTIARCAAGTEIPLPAASDIHALVDRICFVNFRQWQLEDELRVPGISADQAFATIKRIQASNAERTQLMEQIDRYYVSLTAENPAVEPSASHEIGADAAPVVEFHETLGQLIDILSILYVRRYHTVQLSEQGFEYHPGNGCRVEEAVTAIDQQIALCERSFSRLRTLFLAGQAVLPPLSHFKLYGTPDKSAAQTQRAQTQPIEETA